MARLRVAVGLPLAAVVLPLSTLISHSFGRSSYPLLLPAIKDDLALSNGDAGLASTGMFLAYLTGVLLVTYFASKLEPFTILRTGILISCVGLLILGTSTDFVRLVIGLAFISIGGAGIWITAPALATEGVPPERRGLVIGLLTASIGLGNSVVALSTGAARSSTGNEDLWRPIYLGMAASSIVIGITITALVKPTLPGAALPNEVLPNAVLPDAVLPEKEQTQASDSEPSFSFANLKQLPGWLPLSVAYTLFGAIAAGYISFLAEALEEDGGLTRDHVSLVYVGLGFGMLFGAPLVGWISDRTSRKTALMTVMGLMGIICTMIALATGWLLVVSVLCLGGLWTSYPTLTATYIRDHMDSRRFGQVYGTMTIFFSAASILPPLIAGSIADSRGSFTLPYLLLVGGCIAGIAVLTRLPDRPPHDPTSA